ncbi:amidohydrolase [Natronorubrum sp. JWXQ-INN-674]|uniref:Amidohydrolase n=1 Tax=Natronorubrum halalkaliphilum TaxID=2691917 RepID=A0A6B0VGA2_9EURY|nr:amidohydrolase [Natronorubrum halalkaliphilum]MXV60524.1 amidohydrolase [Natronorubrum halalkaliphilum]
MDNFVDPERLADLRRDFHRRPEPAWREFWTTCRIVDELERLGVTEIHVGPDALATERRVAVPDEEELEFWFEQARSAGARESTLERLEGGNTGAVAVLERGDGPTVALRVDIDGLPIEEATDSDHTPAAEGFRSRHAGTMHACGHDAHATIGLGVLEAVAESDFNGTLKVVFQPSEERIAGGEPAAKSGHLDDVDALIAVHVGLNHPTGTVVPGIEGSLAVRQMAVTFTGSPSHAGAQPNEGNNANQALATAVTNLQGIARHSDGITRVNVGVIEGGTAVNVVSERAYMEVEVRGGTTDLMEYMASDAERVIRSAAEMHNCEFEIEPQGGAPSIESDDRLCNLIATVADDHPSVDRLVETDRLSGSEDAAHLMAEVQNRGGIAAYVGVGTDHPTGHHTSTFDVDETSLGIGVDVLTEAVLALNESDN